MNVMLETEQSKQIERNWKIKLFILRNEFLVRYVYVGLRKLISLVSMLFKLLRMKKKRFIVYYIRHEIA